MKHCLYCHTPFIEKVSWQVFLGLQSDHLLCPICYKKLQPIAGDLCEKCGRMLSKESNFHHKNKCNDCIKWEKDKEWSGLLEKNYSLYVYNDFLKELITKFKYRGDAELAKIFALPMRKIYKKFSKDYVIVPIPLSEKRLYERGFNQAELLAQNIGKPVFALKRMASEDKQSKKRRKERLKNLAKNSFVIEGFINNHIENNDIIIVDDIYTTGATIRQAAKVLKQCGAKSISSITIGR